MTDKKWRDNNPEGYKKQKLKAAAAKRDMDNFQFFNSKMSQLRSRSKEENRECTVDAKYLKSIFPQDKRCPIFKTLFKVGTGNGQPKSTDVSPSIDRIDNTLGYIQGNIQWVSMRANMIMYNATPDEVMAVGFYHYQTYKKSKEQHETL